MANAFRLFLLMTVFLIAGGIAHAQDEEMQRVIDEANAALAKQDYAGAIAIINKARERWYTLYEDARIMGEAYFAIGDFDSAFDELKRAVKLVDEEHRERYEKLLADAGRSRLEQIEGLLKSETNDETIHSLYKRQAEIRSVRNDHDGAIAAYSIVIDRFEDEESILARAAVWMVKEDYSKASDDFDRYFVLHPRADKWQEEFFWALYKAGRADRLIAVTTAVIATDPESRFAYVARGNGYELKSDWAAALKEYESAFELYRGDDYVKVHIESLKDKIQPGPRTLALRAFEEQDYATVLVQAPLALDKEPFDYTVRRTLGRSQFLSGRLDEAIKTLDIADGGQPAGDVNREWLDEAIRARLGQIDQEIAGLTGTNEIIALEQRRADLFVLLKDYTNAVAVDTRLIDKYGVGSALVHRGRQYLVLGEHERAEQDFWSALRNDPNASGPVGELVNLYDQRGDNAALIRVCTTCLGIQPNYEFARSVRARANEAAGDLEAALADRSLLVETSPSEWNRQDRFKLLKQMGRKDTDVGDRCAMLVLESATYIGEFGVEVFRELQAKNDTQEIYRVGGYLHSYVEENPLGPVMQGIANADTSGWKECYARLKEAIEEGWDPCECRAAAIKSLVLNEQFALAIEELEKLKALAQPTLPVALPHLISAATRARTLAADVAKAPAVLPITELLRDLAPDQPEVLAATAQALASTKQTDAAMKLVEEIIAGHPDSIDALEVRASIYFDLAVAAWPNQHSVEGKARIRDSLTRAIADLDRALEIDPDLLWARGTRRAAAENLATSKYFHAEDSTEARESWEKALALEQAAGPSEEIVELCSQAIRCSTMNGSTCQYYKDAHRLRAQQNLKRKEYQWAINDLETLLNLGEIERKDELKQLLEQARAGMTVKLEAGAASGDHYSLIARGKLLLETGQLDAAQKDADAAIRALRDDMAGYLLSIEVAEARDDIAGALRLAEKAALIKPDDSSIRWKIHYMHSTLGDVDWLIDEMTAKLEQAPDALTYRSRGWLYLERLDGVSALADFDRAAELDKDLFVETPRARARMLADAKSADKIMEEARDAISKAGYGSTEIDAAYLTIAWAHYAKGEFSDCLIAYRDAGAVTEASTDSAEMAYRAAQSVNPFFAQQLANEWSRRWGRHDRRWLKRALGSSGRHSLSETVRNFQQAIDNCLDPVEREDLSILIALTYARHGQFLAAQAALYKAASGTLNARLLTAGSEVELMAGDPVAAFELAGAAINLNLADAAALAQRGRVQLARNNLEAAASDFGEALKLSDRCAVAHAGLARIAVFLEKWEDVIAHAARAVELESSNVDARLDRAYATLFSTHGASELDRAVSDLLIALDSDLPYGKLKEEARSAAAQIDQEDFRGKFYDLIGGAGRPDLLIDYANAWARRGDAWIDRAARVSGYLARNRLDDAGRDDARAELDLRHGCELAPDNASLAYWHGVALSRLSRYREAIVPLSRSVQIDGTSARAYAALADAEFGAAGSGESLDAALMSSALEHAEHANRLGPTALAFAVKARAADQRGELSSARGYADRAAELGGASARPYLPGVEKADREAERAKREAEMAAEKWERERPEREEKERRWAAEYEAKKNRPAEPQLDFWDALSKGFRDCQYAPDDSFSRMVEANGAAGARLQENINRELDRAAQVHEVERRFGYYSDTAERARTGQ